MTTVSRIILYGAPIVGMDLSKLKKVPRWQRKKKIPKKVNAVSTPNPQNVESERHQKILENFKHELLFQSLIKIDEKLEFDFAAWRNIYYMKKMQIDESNLNALITSYIEGLMWTFQYYYIGCPSWDWYYPYYYAPLASGRERVLFVCNKVL